MKIRTVWVEGLCCVWERGGEKEQLGSAIIVTDCEGKPKSAIEIKSEMNGNHALIPVQGGDLIIVADQSRGNNYISICRMDNVVDGREMQEMQLVDRLVDGCWKNDVNIFLKPAITAAMQKASTSECTSPTYIKEV
jgi:hypothetical protein